VTGIRVGDGVGRDVGIAVNFKGALEGDVVAATVGAIVAADSRSVAGRVSLGQLARGIEKHSAPSFEHSYPNHR